MEFMVKRTSNREVLSCEEAYQKQYPLVDYRTFKNKEETLKIEPRWFEKGKNHRETKDGMARDFDDKEWFVKIEDLDELLAFQRKYGDLIIKESYDNKDIFEIEIYDESRE